MMIKRKAIVCLPTLLCWVGMAQAAITLDYTGLNGGDISNSTFTVNITGPTLTSPDFTGGIATGALDGVTGSFELVADAFGTTNDIFNTDNFTGGEADIGATNGLYVSSTESGSVRGYQGIVMTLQNISLPTNELLRITGFTGSAGEESEWRIGCWYSSTGDDGFFYFPIWDGSTFRPTTLLNGDKLAFWRTTDESDRRLATLTFDTYTDKAVVRFLHPALPNYQTSYVENYYNILDIRHPDGIESVTLYKDGASKPSAAKSVYLESDRHESGYFIRGGRMKTAWSGTYTIEVDPIGGEPYVLPYKISKTAKDTIPDVLDFLTISDGDILNAAEKVFIYVDARDSTCGIRASGNWPAYKHMGYRDYDGIKWVELVIDGPDGQTVLHNDRAYITQAAYNETLPYWADHKDPSITKEPEQSWYDLGYTEDDLIPIEGFGLNEFTNHFAAGQYQITLRAEADDGRQITGSTISITVAQSFEDFAGECGLTGNDALSTANPDGGALDNLQEYAFGGDPTDPSDDAGLAPTYPDDLSGSPATTEFQYRMRRDAAAVGLTYTVKYTEDLTNWQSDGLTVLDIVESDDEDYVLVTVSIPEPALPRQFVKLELELTQ